MMALQRRVALGVSTGLLPLADGQLNRWERAILLRMYLPFVVAYVVDADVAIRETALADVAMVTALPAELRM